MVLHQIEHLRVPRLRPPTTRDAKSGAQGDTNSHPRCTFDRRILAVNLIVVLMSLKIN
jgi:hypothetical protein